MATDAEIAWAAGLFEGEGTVALVRGKPPKQWVNLRMQVWSTDLDVLEKFQRIVGGKIYGPYAPKGLGTKPIWTWLLQSVEECKSVARSFLPWLGSRRTGDVGNALKERELYEERRRVLGA